MQEILAPSFTILLGTTCNKDGTKLGERQYYNSTKGECKTF